MALPKCAKCDSLLFETKEFTPSNSNFKLIAVQCAMCGAVVGVLDYYNIGTKLNGIEDALKSIAAVVRASVRFP